MQLHHVNSNYKLPRYGHSNLSELSELQKTDLCTNASKRDVSKLGGISGRKAAPA